MELSEKYTFLEILIMLQRNVDEIRPYLSELGTVSVAFLHEKKILLPSRYTSNRRINKSLLS